MNANILKRLYLSIRSNRLRYYAVTLLKSLGMRHLVVRLDTNNTCNLRCKMCYFNDASAQRTPPMDTVLFNKIAHEVFPKTRILYLSCGAEPLCSPQIGEYVKTAKQYRVPFISMTSNCMLLTEEKCRAFVDNGLDEIIVSITGGTAATYEENHFGATWGKLWNNLGTLERIKGNKKNPVIKFNYILTKKSIRETDRFIAAVTPFRPRFITLREITYFVGMDQEYFNMSKLGTEDIPEINRVKQKFEASGIKVVDSLQCTQEKKPGMAEIPESYPCVQPFFQLYINAIGEVRFCPYRETLGTISNSSLADLLRLETTRAAYNQLKRKRTCVCLHSCPYLSGTGTYD